MERWKGESGIMTQHCLTCIHWKRTRRDGIVGSCKAIPIGHTGQPEWRFQYESCKTYQFGEARKACHERVIREFSLADELLKARQLLGWTQSEVAKLFGVSMSTLYSWEHGINAPAEKYQDEIFKFIEWSCKS